MLINILINTNIASIKLIKRIENTDEIKNKAYTEDTIQEIYTTEKNTKEVIKKIKYFNRKSATFVINQTTS
jgi:hypothetical protein